MYIHIHTYIYIYIGEPRGQRVLLAQPLGRERQVHQDRAAAPLHQGRTKAEYG